MEIDARNFVAGLHRINRMLMRVSDPYDRLSAILPGRKRIEHFKHGSTVVANGHPGDPGVSNARRVAAEPRRLWVKLDARKIGGYKRQKGCGKERGPVSAPSRGSRPVTWSTGSRRGRGDYVKSSPLQSLLCRRAPCVQF